MNSNITKNKFIEGSTGASMVEFSLLIIMIFMLLGFVVDAGFSLHRYLRLTHATTELTRQLSTDIGERMLVESGNNISCSIIMSQAGSTIENYKDLKKAAVENFTFEVTELDSATPPFRLLQLEGTWQGSCIMCNILKFLAGAQFSVTSVIAIETGKSINCTGCTVTCID